MKITDKTYRTLPLFLNMWHNMKSSTSDKVDHFNSLTCNLVMYKVDQRNAIV